MVLPIHIAVGHLVQSHVRPIVQLSLPSNCASAPTTGIKSRFNGRLTYSGDTMNVNNFNETFNGLMTRTFLRQEIDTGGLGNGRLAHNKRDNLDGDFGVEAELSKNSRGLRRIHIPQLPRRRQQ